MDFHAVVFLLVNVFLFSATRAGDTASDVALPAEQTEKVRSMPDLCQTDKAFAPLPDGGRNYCGPTALANVLAAMDGRGYEDLVPGDATSKDRQLALLKQLGSKQYLDTGKSGTGPIAAMRGITRYVRDRGYDVSIRWQGWRKGGEFATGETVDEAWLQEGTLGESNVVVNVGWYKHDATADVYTRVGGHYMTLVGYKKTLQKTLYLIQDPAPRSGPGKVTHQARLVPIDTGELAPWKSYGKRSAPGHFLVEGIVVKRTADVALLDGAIRLAISKR